MARQSPRVSGVSQPRLRCPKCRAEGPSYTGDCGKRNHSPYVELRCVCGNVWKCISNGAVQQYAPELRSRA